MTFTGLEKLTKKTSSLCLQTVLLTSQYIYIHASFEIMKTRLCPLNRFKISISKLFMSFQEYKIIAGEFVECAMISFPMS
jgi:hypothetical protein